MTHITGHDRWQMLLLPEAVDDYVGADNPVRFIDAFVDGLDLVAAGFVRVVPGAVGRRVMLRAPIALRLSSYPVCRAAPRASQRPLQDESQIATPGARTGRDSKD
jgi:hypothetical protein